MTTRGSARGICRDCGEPVWVAPSSRLHLGKGLTVICDHCYRKLIEKNRGELIQYEIAPEATEEVEEAMTERDKLVADVVAEILGRNRRKHND